MKQPAPPATEKQNQNILTSKINAVMLRQCERNINSDQIKELQKYKSNFDKFDHSKDGFRQLIEINLAQFDITEESDKGYSLQVTNSENAILT